MALQSNLGSALYHLRKLTYLPSSINPEYLTSIFYTSHIQSDTSLSVKQVEKGGNFSYEKKNP